MFDSGSKDGGELVPTKTCSMCGLPTKSRFPVCNRADTPCRVEYQRLWAQEQDKEHRNEIARRYRRNQKAAPAVYGILFPVPVVLKIGLTTSSSSALYMGTARQGARKRGWDIKGSSCIWTQPGDVRTEAWMQATLAFRWPGAFGKYQNRICEWFDVSGLTSQAIITALNEIYQGVPVDMIHHRTLTAAAGTGKT